VRLVVVPVHRWRRRARLTSTLAEKRVSGALAAATGDVPPWRSDHEQPCSPWPKPTPPASRKSCRSDATGDRDAVQLRVLNQRGERVALAFPIVRSAVSFQP
jgi:hypothetical protein